jgi:hypothetical protein
MRDADEHLANIEGYYDLYFHGTLGYARIGSFGDTTPGQLWDDWEGEAYNEDIGDFIEAIFRRDGFRDIIYDVHGRWSESAEIYHRPKSQAEYLAEFMERVKAARGGERE